jgi:hypothetical protein
MINLDSKLIDLYYINEFETQGFTYFSNDKFRYQLGNRCSEYASLSYEKQRSTIDPRGFIIYPGEEEKLKFPKKEEVVERFKKRKMLNRQMQIELFKEKYETVLNWLCIQYNGKEEF